MPGPSQKHDPVLYVRTLERFTDQDIASHATLTSRFGSMLTDVPGVNIFVAIGFFDNASFSLLRAANASGVLTPHHGWLLVDGEQILPANPSLSDMALLRGVLGYQAHTDSVAASRLNVAWAQLTPRDCEGASGFFTPTQALFDAPPPDLAHIVYDSVAALAIALYEVADPRDSRHLLSTLGAVNFSGTSGRLAFEPDFDRAVPLWYYRFTNLSVFALGTVSSVTAKFTVDTQSMPSDDLRVCPSQYELLDASASELEMRNRRCTMCECEVLGGCFHKPERGDHKCTLTPSYILNMSLFGTLFVCVTLCVCSYLCIRPALRMVRNYRRLHKEAIIDRLRHVSNNQPVAPPPLQPNLFHLFFSHVTNRHSN
jgi:hypothetical protein